MKQIRNRIFVTILIPVLLVYVLVIIGGASLMTDSFRDEAMKQKTISAENIARGISDWLLSRISEALQLSRIPLFASADEEAIRSYMVEWQDTLSFHFDRLLLVDRSGEFWSTDGESGTLDAPEFLARFYEEQSLFTYGGPDRFGSILSDHFVIGAPIFVGDTIEQVLVATVPTSTMRRIFGFFTFADFDAWMIVNARDTIITHDDPQMIGKSERQSYGRVFLSHGDYGDQVVFVSVLRNGWKFVTFLDRQTLMAPYATVWNVIIIFSAFLVAIVTVFVLILSSTIVRPIRRLTDGVHRIMAGDYKTEIRLNTRDELNELAESFNRLSSRMVTLRTNDRFSFLGHISARMAHELRKPLHVVQLAVQSLPRNGEEQERYLRIIDEEVENADRFIKQILNFAHTDTGDKALYPIADVVRVVGEKYQLIADAEAIDLEIEIEEPIPEIYLDVLRMEEALSNVLQNAIDSINETEPAPKQRRIRVRLDATEQHEIRLSVRDTGGGFDEEVIDVLFDPYFTSRDNGTGLGLSICYRFAMDHGAQLLLENDEEHHGLVTFKFPV